MHPAIAYATHREQIAAVAARYGVSNLRVFGSVARGQAREDSDLDLLVDLERGRSMADHIAFEEELENLLGCPVDVVTEKGLSPYIRASVLDPRIPPMNRDEVHLRHIIDAISRIEEYASGGEARFRAETVFQDAIIRQMEIVGEAVKNISGAFSQRFSELPWSDAAKNRDFLIHCYPKVNLDRVWEGASEELPSFKRAAECVLAILVAEQNPPPP